MDLNSEVWQELTKRLLHTACSATMALCMQRQCHQNLITGKLPMLPKNDD